MGLLIIVLFYRSAKEHNDSAFRWMWLTIVLSFGFYIPVLNRFSPGKIFMAGYNLKTILFESRQ